MTPQHKIYNNILSIDVESHIQNLASKTYRSPAHYPVELVRAAIQRGAHMIKMTIKKGLIVIHDNGSGINPHQIKMLHTLVDSKQPTTVREKVIKDLLRDDGIGLLAIFSPSPERISIENVFNSEKKQLLIHNGKVQEQNTCNLSSGTRITLFRKNYHWDQEEVILRDYCKFVTVEIILNGNPIEKKHILSSSMVSIKITNTENYDEAWVGIPKNGDICRIWLLNQRIPWYHTTISPWNGFIFEAAIEHSGKLTSNILNQISQGGYKLYQWLTKKYHTYPPQYQSRIEEIIFKHHRLTGNSQLLDQFSPFRIIQSPKGITVSNILEYISKKGIYAIPSNEDPSNYNITKQTVLLLSNTQTDFLINHLQIPIPFLSPISHTKFKLKNYLQSLFMKWQNWFNKIHIGRRKTIQDNKMTPEEILLIEALTSYHSGKIRPFLIDSRGFFPSFVKLEKKRNNASALFIRRKHPLVRKAIHAIVKDPVNIEIISPLFVADKTIDRSFGYLDKKG